MNVRMTKEEFDNLPIKEEIKLYPTPNQYYKDLGGGVSISRNHNHNWSNYFWDHFCVTFVDKNGHIIK